MDTMTTDSTERRPPPTWRELHPGDDPAVESRQFACWAETSPDRKLHQLRTLLRYARRAAWNGLRGRLPDATDEELRQHLRALLIEGDEAAVGQSLAGRDGS
jgi:hypothetical protein